MLELNYVDGRESIEKYFYGGKSWWEFFVPSFILRIVRFLLSKSSEDERLYDDILQKDLAYLDRRAIDVMGLVEEEFSLIDPIFATGYASEEAVKGGVELEVEKKDLLKVMLSYLFAIPMAIYKFFRRLFGKKDFVSHLVFFEGYDGNIRSSLVSRTVITFTEQQIVSYTCNFDIALGIILEEYVREVFYRDVDSVNYGDETFHIYSDGTVQRTMITQMRLAVSSGTDIVASVVGKTELLSNQIMAMKSLVRSKKEEMS